MRVEMTAFSVICVMFLRRRSAQYNLRTMTAVLSRQVDSYELAARELSQTFAGAPAAELDDLVEIGVTLYEQLESRADEARESARLSGVPVAERDARSFLETFK